MVNGVLECSDSGPSAAVLEGDFMVGATRVSPALNRVHRDDVTHQLEPKVMQVLLLLAARPGEVIGRRALLSSVWGSNATDDYLLNRAISELRRVFGDSAQSPGHIETIRKTGYRLIAPVRLLDPPAPAAEPAPVERAAVATLTRPKDSSPRTGWRRPALWITGLALAAVVVVVGVLPQRPASDAPGTPLESRPLTSYPGLEQDAALSPDASRLVFAWDKATGSTDIYMKALGSEALLNLTRTDADERFPVWTADGRSVLFLRRLEHGHALLRVSAVGGATTELLRLADVMDVRGMAASPTGGMVAVAVRTETNPTFHVLALPLDGMDPRALTEPPADVLGDIDPLFTADGRELLFVRARNEVTKDIHALDLAQHRLRRLTRDNRKVNGIALASDGANILFTSTRSGMYALWSVPVAGGAPVRMPFTAESIQRPVTVPGQRVLVYEQWTHSAAIRRIDPLTGTMAGGPASTRWDSSPSLSRDQTRLAFTSNRSGPHSIWVSDRDGGNARQVANLGGVFLDSPAWSPDDNYLAFDGSPNGKSDIWLVPAAGGEVVNVTDEPGDNRNPTWSADGRWIYFESNRAGPWQIYAKPVAGGASVLLSPQPAVNPQESADGRWLLYARPGGGGIWRMPARGWAEGTANVVEQRLVEALAPEYDHNWAVAREQIIYLQKDGQARRHLVAYHLADGSSTRLANLPDTGDVWGFDVSAAGDEVVYTAVVDRQSDLYAIEY